MKTKSPIRPVFAVLMFMSLAFFACSITDGDILPSPANVTATENSEGTIIVSWQAVYGAAGYYIYRSESVPGVYTLVGDSKAALYIDSSLPSEAEYYYKVAAYNSAGGPGYQSKSSGDDSNGSGGEDGEEGDGYVIYGGETYETVLIDTQIWMKRNLNYNASGSIYYGNGDNNSLNYGRLYNWATAMNLPNDCNSNTCSDYVQDNHRGICPSGWHIPTREEWRALIDFVGGEDVAAEHLKSTSGWLANSGLDTYGFAALPSGFGEINDLGNATFSYAGVFTAWWGAFENGSYEAYARRIWFDEGTDDITEMKDLLLSIRCVKN